MLDSTQMLTAYRTQVTGARPRTTLEESSRAPGWALSENRPRTSPTVRSRISEMLTRHYFAGYAVDPVLRLAGYRRLSASGEAHEKKCSGARRLKSIVDLQPIWDCRLLESAKENPAQHAPCADPFLSITNSLASWHPGSGMAFCESLAITPNRASAAGSPLCHCKAVTAILFDAIVTTPFPYLDRRRVRTV